MLVSAYKPCGSCDGVKFVFYLLLRVVAPPSIDCFFLGGGGVLSHFFFLCRSPHLSSPLLASPFLLITRPVPALLPIRPPLLLPFFRLASLPLPQSLLAMGPSDRKDPHPPARSGGVGKILPAVAAILFLLFIAALVLLILAAIGVIAKNDCSVFTYNVDGNPAPPTTLCGNRDYSHNRYNFPVYPFPMPTVYILACMAGGLLCAVVIAVYAMSVVKRSPGDARMQEIAGYIAEGAVAFLRTEYLALVPLVVLLFLLLGFVAQNWPTAGCYLIGAVLSGGTGYIGMKIATVGNVRTTAASEEGLSSGLNVAFRAGSVMGLAVVSVGLTGLSVCYLIFRDVRALAGFSAGASTVALFARVGGGIYTKAADVGADLVGKVEANIPEDDPRNPATIADNVGDNVGDVAGMGADLFESYVGSIVATAILGSSLPYFYRDQQALCVFNHLGLEYDMLQKGCTSAIGFSKLFCRQPEIVNSYPNLLRLESNMVFVMLPFLLALSGVLVAILCTLYVYVPQKLSTETDKASIMESLLWSLRYNIFTAGALVIACSAALCFGLFYKLSDFYKAFSNLVSVAKVDLDSLESNCPFALKDIAYNISTEGKYKPMDTLFVRYPEPEAVAWRLFVCILIGLVLGNLIGSLTEYFTAGSYTPTQRIAQAGEYGAGAVVIEGLGVGLLSTGLPLVLVGIAIIGTYQLFGTYGIALAAVGMLSTLGVTMATDAYGPVADNAGGIAEMAELDASVRDTTDALDALGNTTAATGKGFSNGSAVLTAYALLTALVQDSGLAPSPYGIVVEDKTLLDYDSISLVDPFVVFAILIGVCLPYIFGAFTMLAVSRAAQAMIVEVRRQFREIVGLREGAPGVRPEHVRCIAISTTSSLSEMVLPGLLAIMAPLIVGFGFGQKALVALLLAAIVSGYMMGILMSNAGGAWDNSKKLVESGFFGKLNAKGSEWHKATVAGDTVGDPFKDTSGPSMNILIKMMTTFGLVTVALMQRDRTRGWIGAIFLGATIIVMVGYAFGLSKINAKTKRDATQRAVDAGSMEDAREGVPLTTDS